MVLLSTLEWDTPWLTGPGEGEAHCLGTLRVTSEGRAVPRDKEAKEHGTKKVNRPRREYISEPSLL